MPRPPNVFSALLYVISIDTGWGAEAIMDQNGHSATGLTVF
jgi:hypothetical protein